jgi:hypothetical protein
MMRCASVIISRIIAAASARVSVIASSIDKPLLAIVTAPDAVILFRTIPTCTPLRDLAAQRYDQWPEEDSASGGAGL